MPSPRSARASTLARPTVHLALCAVVLFAAGACSLFTDLSGLSDGAGTTGAADAGDAATEAAIPPGADAGPPCVDTRSDPLHCGRCGHSCLGDMCADGACVPAMVATTPMGIGGIDVDDTRVYWSSYVGDGSGKLLAVDKTLGGSPTVLIDSPEPRFRPKTVLVDGAYVAVVNGASGNGTSAIYRVAKAGGIPARVASACVGDGAVGLTAVANDYFFGFDRGVPAVLQATKTGGGCDGITGAGIVGIETLATDGTAIFATQGSQGGPIGGLFRFALPGGDPVALAPTLVETANGVAVDGDTLVVATGAGTIITMGKDGSNAAPLTPETEGAPHAILTDANGIYWANESSGEIVGFDRTTKTRRILATGQKSVYLLAGDANRLYWPANGKIMRVTK
jgi:hypothetical protein